MNYFIILLTLIVFSHSLDSQTIEPRNYNIQPLATPPVIDGEIKTEEWAGTTVTTDFWMQQPVDDKKASQKTEVRLGYDQNFIYVAAYCYDDNEYVITSLKRDRFKESDEFYISFDPVNKKTNGFGFGVNAGGAQMEATLFADDGDASWDNKWYSAVKKYDNHWQVEMAIPLKSLRYKGTLTVWGMNMARHDPANNELHVWNPVPRQFNDYDLGYFGTMTWVNAPQKQQSNVSIIPYASTRINQISGEYSTKQNIGADAKIALSSSLNLDLTVNPDFSQVEVDDQVTNLTRFNIFFPEKRQFFIENADIFDFGQGIDQPFYSRRIGLDGSGNTVPISYGLRLTGNLDSKTRIGFLNMHSQTTETSNGQNYSAIAAHRRIGKRSLIKGLFLNRQAFDSYQLLSGDYNRNYGIETDLSTDDGRWQATGGYLLSDRKDVSGDNSMIHGGLFYNGTKFRAFVQGKHLGANYHTDMGFSGRTVNYDFESKSFIRLGNSQMGSMLNYYIYPTDSKRVNYHWSGIENFLWGFEGHGLTEWYMRIRHFIFYKNTSQVRFRLNHHYVDLIFPFALTDVPFPVKKYRMTEFNIDLRSDQRKKWIANLFVVYGGFYEGTKLTILSDLSYRWQPWGIFSVGLEYNDINQPNPYGDVDIVAWTGRADVSLSTSLFWSTFIQYNTQADNFNINSRLQWRFAPMSDLFFVYTDNYRVEHFFGNKNRSFVIKFNYWFSL